ncbi:MAG: hypothetical protein LLG00_03040 [Planctomycetaceae bacterium]|nr:hypothetical protein [Planctomycetaceae bacterium]
MASCPPLRSWPHRLAWMLAIVVFALISMGGTVTTYEAGMAVRDWPTTFDYWFYPIRAWLAVWDVFLEHGHRLLGQLAGVLAVALAALLWRQNGGRWARWVAVGLLLGVVVQGTLGGLRVLADDRVLARVHGCIAPLYFALCAAVVTWTSRQWAEAVPDVDRGNVAGSSRSAWLLVAAMYLEIVLGALLRRPSSTTMPVNMWLLVWLKVINAALIAVLGVWLCLRLRGQGKRAFEASRQVDNLPHKLPRLPHKLPHNVSGILRRRALWLAAALMLQLVLAAATWVTNYGWPEWFTHWVVPLQYTVIAQGRLQILATTAHAAAGSLLLALSLTLVLWLRRGSSLPR